MGARTVLFVGLASTVALATRLAGLLAPESPRARPAATADVQASARKVDAAILARRSDRSAGSATAAPELARMRRLGLALTGSIPSLEEIRRFEAAPPAVRLDAWLDELLAGRRSSEYLAERLARTYVGTEAGPFLVFRRRRFVAWLAEAIGENRPYDAIVRALIADRGLWTDHPGTNFLTANYDAETERPDPERVAARVSRAFLGVRLDCARCHDHPFQPWTRADFRGLAAFFGGLHSDIRGIRDGSDPYRPAGLAPSKAEVPPVEPRVPFRPELRPGTGTPRDQLAAWVVDPKNPNLALVTANRAWALLFGKPLAEPIDDLPPPGERHPALEILAADFAEHGYDFRRLLRTVAATEAFRLDSLGDDPDGTQAEGWAAFPITRLRPEQVAGAVAQAGSLATLGTRGSWLNRLADSNGRAGFIARYGDAGEDEFAAEGQGGTVPQRLLLLNGDFVASKTDDQPFGAAAQVARLAPTDRRAVEVAYLVALTRRPSPREQAHFEAKLKGIRGDERNRRIGDLLWTLLNASESSWNH